MRLLLSVLVMIAMGVTATSSRPRVAVAVPMVSDSGTTYFATQLPTLPEPPEDNKLDMFKYAVTQGGLAMVLLVVFWSYRRDFLRRSSTEREEKEQLIRIVERNSEVLMDQVNAVVLNTAATNRLATAVEAIERRR